MVIDDQEILQYIRNHYKGFENYNFKVALISDEGKFIVVKDIHEINEDLLDVSKDIFIRGLQLNRQTNSINIVNICDSVNAEISGFDEEIYKALEEYNKIYTKAFLRNGSRWVDLKAFNLCCEKALEVIGNRNPRTMFNISKYTYLLNNNLLNTANIRLSLVNLRSCLELMHLEIRKMNYDMVMRPVTTIDTGDGSETIIKSKYVSNFKLHYDLNFDHENLVFGTLAGLVARKNSGVFGDVRPYLYQFDLIDLLKRDYAYLNLDIEVREEPAHPVFVNNKQIAHQVVLKKKIVTGNFSPFSSLTGKLLARYKFPKSADVFDYENPIELAAYSTDELTRLLESNDAILVYRIDETLFDSYNIYDTINPQSGIVVEKGEYFNAPYNLFGIKYVSKTTVKNLWGFWEQVLLFSKTNKSDQLQRIKLFDSLMMQQRNTIARAEQAESLVRDLQKSNERINELNATLTEKVRERTQQLEQLNEQQRMNFVNLVHETKTPLTLVNNYLEEYINTHGSAQELEIIKTAVNKLTKDMLNLFDMERFTKGIGVYKHNHVCDFSKILKDCLVLFEQYCKKQDLTLKSEIQDDVLIKADPHAINRIVNNLIENAVKFSEAGGCISIVLKSQADKNLFKVTDTGKGIPLTLQKKIFEPYFQINNETTSLQGMGLGLPIVKKVTDSLDGTVSIDSEPGKGTSVTITLNAPVLESNETIAEVKKMIHPSCGMIDLKFPQSEYIPQRASILLVDDNKTMLNYLYNKLLQMYNMFFAFNGAEALKLIQDREIRPDLIISDVMMDKMDGFTFAKILSEHKSLNHIPIIFLTAISTQNERVKGLRLGAVDWIQKPFSFEELHMKVESLLDRIKKQQQSFIRQTVSNLQVAYQEEYYSVDQKPSMMLNCKKYRLTERECEIVELVQQGFSNKIIADKLSIAERTVSTHIQNIYQKVSVSSKTELLNKLQER
jgi:signal transduction histidine kinase/DNA-binding NarL/FixJ family response regulator